MSSAAVVMGILRVKHIMEHFLSSNMKYFYWVEIYSQVDAFGSCKAGQFT